MRRLNANTHLKTASPLLAVEFRLVVEILISGLPTIRPECVIGHFYVRRDYSVRMGIGKGRALPGNFVDAVCEGAPR